MLSPIKDQGQGKAKQQLNQDYTKDKRKGRGDCGTSFSFFKQFNVISKIVPSAWPSRDNVADFVIHETADHGITTGTRIKVDVIRIAGDNKPRENSLS